MSERFYLVDGSSYIFRAFYAIAPLSTSNGLPTNALLGFTRMLLKLFEGASSNHLVMVFDAGKITFRNELYDQYKANRSECPEELIPQFPYFRKISKALGFQLYELEGYEADDIIGTIAKKLEECGHEVVIVSGDKDLMQLVTPKVTIWDTMKDRRYGEKEVKEKMGVRPDQVIDFLGLTGDSSDNIPGLKGVGPKTAIQLIENYGSIEEIIKRKEEIIDDKSIRSRKKIKERLDEDEEILRLSKKLVTIDSETPVNIICDGKEIPLAKVEKDRLGNCLYKQDVDSELLNELKVELEFESVFRDIPSPKKESIKKDYVLIGVHNYKKFLSELCENKKFAFDIETTDLDPKVAKVVGISFCYNDERAYYLPFAHSKEAIEDFEQCDLIKVLADLKPIFENESYKKLGQNLKYDIEVLRKYDIRVNGVGGDSMLGAFLLEPDRRGFSLEDLALRFLQVEVSTYENTTKDKNSFSEVLLEDACNYASEDAHIAWLLCNLIDEKIKEENLEQVYFEIELPLISVLSDMELSGIELDVKFLSELSSKLTKKIEELEKQQYELAGEEFNLNSPKQLSVILFEKLEIPTKGLKKTKTGISTDASVLEKLSDEFELPRLLLKYRMLHKLRSTYVDALPKQISNLTNRLHTQFNQTIAATGRLSSSNPNLQNIPIQSEEGRQVRKAFVSKKGSALISADYSQIELRILAHLSQDANFIKAFKNDYDIHSKTARDILFLNENEEITPDLRRIGKVINFGIIYGMSAFRLSRELGLTLYEARDYIDNYFKHYSGVKIYFDTLEEQAESQGFVTTLFGRKRYMANLDSSGRGAGFIQRVAINAPIQGTAADIVKLAMLKINERIINEELGLKMLLQIHDELVFECDERFVESASSLIKEEMEQVVKLSVPLKVSIASGLNWEEAH